MRCMSSEEHIPDTETREFASRRRLDSWKEIAVHLNRDIRTVQLWEKREGLPVHRHSHNVRASVFAFDDELNTWQNARHAQPATYSAPVSPSQLPVLAESHSSDALHKRPAFALAAAIVTAATVLLGSTFHQKTVHTKIDALLRDKTLVVLPFADHSPEPQETYLAAGLVDDLVTDIGRGGQLHVVSPGFAQSGSDTLQTAHPDLIIEGTVLRLGQQMRVTVRLINTSTGRDVWVEAYKRSSSDVLSLQDDIAQEIATDVISNLEQGKLN